jgi:hypothetical protein
VQIPVRREISASVKVFWVDLTVIIFWTLRDSLGLFVSPAIEAKKHSPVSQSNHPAVCIGHWPKTIMSLQTLRI